VAPPVTANLVCHYDADALGLGDGVAISQWDDSSGNGNHATQATGANQPTCQTNELNGRSVVRFDGTNDYFVVADHASYKAAALTIFAVAKSTGGTADQRLINYPHAGTHTSPFFRWALQIDRGAVDDVSIYVDGVVTQGGSNSSAWRVYVFDTATARLWMEADALGSPTLNGADDATITYPNAVGLRIGANVTPAEYWIGDMAEILVYAATLSDADRALVEKYLEVKWGIPIARVVQPLPPVRDQPRMPRALLAR
jgi:hypothetical protein